MARSSRCCGVEIAAKKRAVALVTSAAGQVDCREPVGTGHWPRHQSRRQGAVAGCRWAEIRFCSNSSNFWRLQGLFIPGKPDAATASAPVLQLSRMGLRLQTQTVSNSPSGQLQARCGGRFRLSGDPIPRPTWPVTGSEASYGCLRYQAMPSFPRPRGRRLSFSQFSASAPVGVGEADDCRSRRGPAGAAVQQSGADQDVLAKLPLGPRPEQGSRVGRGPRARFRTGVGRPQFRGALIETPGQGRPQAIPPGAGRPERSWHSHRGDEDGAPWR